ncbi:MAG: beta-N-acetylglucosaminidase domain-containing protein [Cyanosarcina radialis HA8281-LM2]|jgi:hypothetical protein|nr:beta-N-acetylglucosaminidase domain-containing protein [Cyanosarcina radialis HA8281-LM2]
MDKLSNSNYGVIEGFFGLTWTWETRKDYANFLKNNGYSYYIYAPKADDFLRKNWQQNWSASEFESLKEVGDTYHRSGLQWGIGLSPFEIYKDYNDEAIASLKQKILSLNDLNIDILAILFDDMRGDFYKLAKIQTEVIQRVMDLSTAKVFIMCPTYYTDNRILDRLFGERPQDYLETLGKTLDPQVNIFWTGPDVCSKSYPESHLKEVAQRLGRKPFIWDNYPVNDGARMSKFLHLRAFENRPSSMAELTVGHAVNPMNQAYLSQIPLMTLNLSYQQGDRYSPTAAFIEAVKTLCPEALANCLLEDLPLFQDEGLDRINSESKAQLIDKYTAFNNPYSQEIIGWLQGEYPVPSECLTG